MPAECLMLLLQIGCSLLTRQSARRVTSGEPRPQLWLWVPGPREPATRGQGHEAAAPRGS